MKKITECPKCGNQNTFFNTECSCLRCPKCNEYFGVRKDYGR